MPAVIKQKMTFAANDDPKTAYKPASVMMNPGG